MRLPNIVLASDQIAAFCRRWHIAELSLFGSVLRDDFGRDSDVDVLVSFEPGAAWSLLDIVTMQDELTAIVGRPVDLVEEVALRNPFRRSAIANSKQVVYAA
jgi:predicted nucleotidyltransferase